ncbi:MAG: phosphoglycerate dehydrogenase, partial [Sediminibacterium sp.]|nr:phosphoglycerate dehydrogenase [Sediminibacterium sp.]
ILFLENINEKAVSFLNNQGYSNITRVKGAFDEKKLLQEISEYHIIGIRSKTQLTKKVLEAAKKLQAIGCFCIGVNQVDLQVATKLGIAVFNAPYSNTRSVAELVIASIIMLMRKIPEKNKLSHAGIWGKDSANCFEVRGKTLGIIGYGNIGMQLGILAEALSMQVIFYDIETKLPFGNSKQVKSLVELVSNADVISIHVPETIQTKHLINKELLTQFKKNSILINYARGEVVDLESLKKAILSNHISGAAIDVFPVEPAKNGDTFVTPLQGIPNVILTPHIGGSTEEAQLNIGEDVSKKMFDYLENGTSTNSFTVPPLSLPTLENAHRILHIHKNKPGILSAINALLSNENINIIGQYLKTNDEIGYVVLDIDKSISSKVLNYLKLIDDTIKVRVLY